MKNNQDRTIGIIGGVGPQATRFIYEKIIEFSQNKYGAKNNDDYPRIIIFSVPIPDFIADTKKLNLAKKMLIEAVKSLTQVGATKLCIASNTVHILLDSLAEETAVEFFSVIKLVARKCQNLGFKKVGILGSPVLLNSGLYQQELEKYHIQVILLDNKQIKMVEEIIRNVLAGKKDGEKKKEYIDILNDFFKRGAEGIILGCTELPMAVNYEALGNRTINSDEVLAEELTDYYYN